MRPLFRAVALVAVLASASGCGGDGDGPDTGGAAEAGTRGTGGPRAAAAADVAARPSPGCRAGVPPAPGSRRVELPGGDRWYLLDVPSSAEDADEPLPVVVDLHGLGETAEDHRAVSAMGELGERERFVTVTPSGRGDPVRWDPRPGSADVEFVLEVLDRTVGELCVDEARVYVAGFSSGAFLASTLACEASGRLAAVAAVAGVRNPAGCRPDRPVGIVAVHGTFDGHVGYEGGLGDAEGPAVATLLGRDMPGALYDSVPAIVDAWAERNGCDGQDAADELAPDVERFGFDCPPGADVELHRVEGGGHTWPGPGAQRRTLGPTSTSLDATAAVWAFFERHARAG